MNRKKPELSPQIKQLGKILTGIAASILIPLGGFGTFYSRDPIFWIIMLLLGLFLAYSLMDYLEKERKSKKNP